ncbi:hypothetical protein [Pedobacter sp. MC2016-24]|uniref:hypothetical protein n=1 Tax=Pedobacter sp. MC2016-24 TaxID=2780090 RepID=UPI00188031DB|nr:hypothetical protein [Pedobacter sp. MC2016-24]MBE9598445.1 hypothetical protein [Pedobacter sp. MC2016-24]
MMNEYAIALRKKNDELLKGALEANFPDFLRFVYPDADQVVDFSKGIQFMDKELFAIIPNRERKRDGRRADLLAKLHLKNGTEKWVLLNVEIEGGNDVDFEKRVYEYNYRIRDKYKVSVATIAVFTGGKSQRKPRIYRDELLGTVLSFSYLTYHIFDHDQEVLLKMDNPFALIALACQKSILEGKIPEKQLGEERLIIAKALLSHNYDHDRIISFLIFIKNFIYINNEDINCKFDQLISELTGGEINMGILEIVRMQDRRDAKLEGKLEGQHEAALKIARELKKEGLTVDFIAKTTKLSHKEITSL